MINERGSANYEAERMVRWFARFGWHKLGSKEVVGAIDWLVWLAAMLVGYKSSHDCLRRSFRYERGCCVEVTGSSISKVSSGFDNPESSPTEEDLERIGRTAMKLGNWDFGCGSFNAILRYDLPVIIRLGIERINSIAKPDLKIWYLEVTQINGISICALCLGQHWRVFKVDEPRITSTGSVDLAEALRKFDRAFRETRVDLKTKGKIASWAECSRDAYTRRYRLAQSKTRSQRQIAAKAANEEGVSA